MLARKYSSVPSEFLCPITREVMEHPVLLIDDGHSYELSAIERWLSEHNSSPMTNKPLSDRRFVHNYNLKSIIGEHWTKQNIVPPSPRFLAFHIRFGRIPNEWKTETTLKIRLSLLGASNVGKTSLARYLQYGGDSIKGVGNTTATTGPDLLFFYLDQLYEDKYVIIIQLSDIPGMERYESCSDSHFRNCHGAVLVTDSTEILSLERIEHYWYKQLQAKGKEHVESVLLCNKFDLLQTNSDEQQQSTFPKLAEEFASSHNISIYHTSVLSGDNIASTFKHLILHILSNPSLLQEIKENATTNEPASPLHKSLSPKKSPIFSLRSTSIQSRPSELCCRL